MLLFLTPYLRFFVWFGLWVVLSVFQSTWAQSTGSAHLPHSWQLGTPKGDSIFNFSGVQGPRMLRLAFDTILNVATSRSRSGEHLLIWSMDSLGNINWAKKWGYAQEDSIKVNDVHMIARDGLGRIGLLYSVVNARPLPEDFKDVCLLVLDRSGHVISNSKFDVFTTPSPTLTGMQDGFIVSIQGGLNAIFRIDALGNIIKSRRFGRMTGDSSLLWDLAYMAGLTQVRNSFYTAVQADSGLNAHVVPIKLDTALNLVSYRVYQTQYPIVYTPRCIYPMPSRDGVLLLSNLGQRSIFMTLDTSLGLRWAKYYSDDIFPNNTFSYEWRLVEREDGFTIYDNMHRFSINEEGAVIGQSTLKPQPYLLSFDPQLLVSEGGANLETLIEIQNPFRPRYKYLNSIDLRQESIDQICDFSPV